MIDILHKMKENLGQEHVKRGQELEQFLLIFPEKWQFSSFNPTSPPVPP